MGEQVIKFQRELDKARTLVIEEQNLKAELRLEMQTAHDAMEKELRDEIKKLNRTIERGDVSKLKEMEGELARANQYHSEILTDFEEEVARSTTLEKQVLQEQTKLQAAENQVRALRDQLTEIQKEKPPEPAAGTRIRRSRRFR